MATAEESASEAFAARLRALRDGSGRTYASLARRVDISASTLHRYCVGRTVPIAFAPVERLARFCGCGGDDLAALHRLWIMADAERNRRRVPVPSLPAAPVTAGGSTKGEGGGDGREPVVRAPARRRGPYAATALLATLITLTLIVVFGGTPFSGADGPGAAVEKSEGRVPGAERPRRAVVPSPAAPSSGAPSPDVTPSPSGDAAAGAVDRPRQPRATVAENGVGSAGEREGDALPLSWTTDDHIWKNGCDHGYLLGGDTAEVPPPPVEADAESWARSLGAVHASDTGVRITLQGKGERAVVLESLRIRVTARREPPKRDVYRMNHGCGGALTPRLFDVDLDLPRPLARSVAGNDSGEPIAAVAFPYSVSATDPEVFLVTGRTAGCDCDWYGELRWSAGGRSGTVRIDDNGSPFRTSGARGRPVYDYDSHAGRWVRAEPEAPLRQRGGGPLR
ncbi:helix-turn-helix domain-containing protein [Streptomyces sp. NBC_01237]|uniref:helix-turn-helix domain-containing protein n=1 Tax=Streptomyces sp. NBC_01237 TaxID=2903790 RepID=UPI002DDBFA56|nr:helix-turn-helix transcriptional regulator [Streptomyces sp. NBC_01237]WRZ77895.1 helix-turn-helix domain-containing protein [Streptomyces sp. NBC_01237]